MSDPSLVQISFKIKPEMPYDMKKFILSAFTDYYEKYYPEKILDVDDLLIAENRTPDQMYAIVEALK